MKTIEEIRNEYAEQQKIFAENMLAQKRKEEKLKREIEKIKPDLEKRLIALLKMHKGSSIACTGFFDEKRPYSAERLLGLETPLEFSALREVAKNSKVFNYTYSSDDGYWSVRLANFPTNDTRGSSSFAWVLFIVIILAILFFMFKQLP